MNVAQMDRADFFAVLAPHFHRVVDRAVSRTPTDEERVALLVAVNFRHRNFFGELAQFVAAFGGHGHVQLRAAGRMPHLIVLESGQERIFSIENASAGRDVLRDLIELIRHVRLPRSEIRFRIDH